MRYVETIMTVAGLVFGFLLASLTLQHCDTRGSNERACDAKGGVYLHREQACLQGEVRLSR